MEYSVPPGEMYAQTASGPLALLGTRRHELRRQLEALDPDRDSEHDHAPGEIQRIDDTVVQQRQSAAAVLAVLQEELRQVERALERAARGLYGACEDCGGMIAPRRLQVVPAATRCVACQQRCESRPE